MTYICLRNKCCFLFATMLLTFGCAGQATDYYPAAHWREASPQSQGLNEHKLDKFVQQLEAGQLQGPITSFLMVKNGYLVINKTFGQYDGSQAHTLQSVTKSITSTLVGLAIQNGFIENMEQKVLHFFPEYQDIKYLNTYKKEMNLHHALTMRTGQAWTGERHLGALNRFSGDKMKYVLDYKMETQAGKKWYYNSGIAILMGGLLQNATGQNTIDFAQTYLFDPLQITSADWKWSHKGIPHTGGGLFLSPTDLAKIGYLYLRNGKWKDQQLLPKWWVKQATSRHVPHTQKIEGISKIGYGYMWWLLPLDKKNTNNDPAVIYMAYGHWGQFIFVIPQHDVVVVFTNDDSATYSEETRPISLLYQYVLPSIQD